MKVLYALTVVGGIVSSLAGAPTTMPSVPNGFVVEMVAGPPLVERPYLAGLDDRGRLYVCDSAGVNDEAEVLLKNRPHRIRRLEDTDGDGKFDRSTVFAE